MPPKSKSKKREVKAEELCPCGSGEKYKYCHKKTIKKFFEYENGDILAEIPLSPEIVQSLKETREEFKAVFGRYPYKSDPVFWNRAEIKQNTYLKRSKKIMQTAKIPEELIFAYEKTGFIIASHSKAVSQPEKKEFSHAIEEYFFLKESGFNPFYIFTYLEADQYASFLEVRKLIKEISAVCNLSIEYTMNSIKIKDQFDNKIYILSSFRSALQSIEFIADTISDIYRDECLIISRAIIEHYLRIKSLRLGTLDSQVILYGALASRGILEYAKRSTGKTDYNKVISEKGEQIEIGYSYSSLAKRTGDPKDNFIYEYTYRTLSNFVHRDASDRIISALKEGNLTSVVADVDDDEIAGTYICSKIIFYYLEEFLENDWLNKKTVKDIRRKLNQLSHHLDTLEENTEIGELGF